MELSFIRKHILVILTLVCIAVSSGLLFQAVNAHTQPLKVIFLDVGQGDATLIITPNGRSIVIDTGPKNNLGSLIAPYLSLTDHDIDLLILTHPDLDHIGGTLSLLKNYKVKQLMHSGLLAGADMYEAIATAITTERIPSFAGRVGQVVQLDKNVYLEIYSPTPSLESFEPNDYSIVSRLVYNNTSVMLMGDASTIIEHDVSEVYGNHIISDILKIGHHGSQTSTGDFFLDTVQPKTAIISAGCNNRFGHPHSEVVARLFIYQVTVLDTCSQGDIEFHSDGEMWTKITN